MMMQLLVLGVVPGTNIRISLEVLMQIVAGMVLMYLVFSLVARTKSENMRPAIQPLPLKPVPIMEYETPDVLSSFLIAQS